MRYFLISLMLAGCAYGQLTVSKVERGTQRPGDLVVTNVTLTGVVYTNDATYTGTVAKAASAFSWGDHSLAGYLGASTWTSWLSTNNYVKAESDPVAIAALAGYVKTNDALYLAAITNVEVVCSGGYRNSTYWFLDYTDIFRTFSETTSVVTNGDLVVSNFVASTTFIDKQMSASVVRGFLDCGSIIWTSSNTNNATIDSNGKLTMLRQGSTVVTGSICSQQKSVTVPLYVSNPGELFSTSYILPASLRGIISTNLDAMIAGGTSTWNRSYWSTIDHAATNYVRDSSCWARDIDLSGVVVSTGGGTPYWHGTLITSQHIAMVKHAYNGVGSVKRFVGASGTVYTRTISALRDPYPGLAWGYGDIMIGKLDSALPTNDVCVYAILPASYTNQFPNNLRNTPCLIYDQSLRCLVADLVSDSGHRTPTDSVRSQFYSLPYVGDSGRPTFLIIPNRKPIFLHMFTYATSGLSMVYARDAINAALSVDGVSLTEADLSGYPTF